MIILHDTHRRQPGTDLHSIYSEPLLKTNGNDVFSCKFNGANDKELVILLILYLDNILMRQ